MRGRMGKQHGYTIVEVLIFLAVSALLFGSTMVLLSGRQQRAQFSDTVRDFETRLIDIANDVSNGYYQSTGNVTCDAALAISMAGTNDKQGTNSDCIMLGRAIKLGYDGAQGKEDFGVYTLVGKRQVADKDVKNLNESDLKLLWVQGNDTANESLRERRAIGFGVTISCVAIGSSCAPGSNANGAIAFITKLSGGVQPGVAGTAIFADTYLYNLLPANSAEATFEKHVDGDPATGALGVKPVGVSSDQTLTICLRSGGTDQYALIRMTGGRVTSEIKGGSTCS